MKTDLVKRILCFIAISYAFTWLVWLPGIFATAGLIPSIPWPPLFAIGTCGPLFAALWCLHREGGWLAVKDWLRQGFTRRFDWGWWLFVLLVPFSVPPLALLIYRLTGGVMNALPVLRQPWMALPVILLMVTIGGGQEEYGWRGYLLPKLDSSWRPWQADVLIIIVHVFWHLPLFFIAATMQSQYPFWLFLAFGIGFSPLINRVYRRTGGSIFVAVLFHGLVNAGLDVFPLVGSAVNNSVVPLLLVGALFCLLTVIMGYGSKRS